MRRITLWLAVTLAVVAMSAYYQVSLSGDGKEGGGHTAATETQAPAGSTSDHTGKPGESK